MSELSRYAEDGVEVDQRSVPHRFPIVSTPWPRWYYVTAVVVQAESLHPHHVGLSPTDDELRIVASFHEQYTSYWYRPGWLAHMRAEHPFDVDDGANGRYLIHNPDLGWGYRRRSWRHGPIFGDRIGTRWDLIGALDHHFASYPDKWVAWKGEHPEVFGARDD